MMEEDQYSQVREVGAPNLRVHLDTYHMNIEEKSFYEAVLSARGLLGHVHASENDRSIPGSGHDRSRPAVSVPIPCCGG